eukprot:scaffold96269_cov78-Phaeocystis_antarctica.AAC.1
MCIRDSHRRRPSVPLAALVAAVTARHADVVALAAAAPAAQLAAAQPAAAAAQPSPPPCMLRVLCALRSLEVTVFLEVTGAHNIRASKTL